MPLVATRKTFFFFQSFGTPTPLHNFYMYSLSLSLSHTHTHTHNTHTRTMLPPPLHNLHFSRIIRSSFSVSTMRPCCVCCVCMCVCVCPHASVLYIYMYIYIYVYRRMVDTHTHTHTHTQQGRVNTCPPHGTQLGGCPPACSSFCVS